MVYSGFGAIGNSEMVRKLTTAAHLNKKLMKTNMI